jgi:hypothetical protein
MRVRQWQYDDDSDDDQNQQRAFNAHSKPYPPGGLAALKS